MKLQILHQPVEPYAYATSSATARIVLLVERRAVESVLVTYGDRYTETFSQETGMEWVGDDGTFDVFRCDVEIETGRLKYRFVLTRDAADTGLFYGDKGLSTDEKQAGEFQLAYFCTRDTFTVPAWTRNAVCYQIFPERFNNGNDALTPAEAEPWSSVPSRSTVLGGDLPGITSKLDYLQDLGVNLLYLTPIFTAYSNHKYDTADYHEVDPQFGTKEDLRKLVESAHQRGIRVVLDAVFNHSGFQFAPFQDVLKEGRHSPYWDWFFIHGSEVDMDAVNYETFANQIATMPKLNVANPEVEAYLLDVAAYWIREFDIDGWRLDVANEIDHVFWRKFRQTVKTVKSEALIIGEVWHNSLPWLRGDQFDGVMNYLFREDGLGFLVDKTLTGTKFGQSLVRLLHLYPEASNRVHFNLLGSHDTQRVLTRAKGDKLALMRALVHMFTFPGIPMLYYGDEVGMVGENDPDCRRGMIWDKGSQDDKLHSSVKRLIKLKQTHPALWTTDLRVVRATKTFIEYKRIADDNTALHVAFNLGRRPVSLSCEGKVLFVTDTAGVSEGCLAPRGAVVWEP